MNMTNSCMMPIGIYCWLNQGYMLLEQTQHSDNELYTAASFPHVHTCVCEVGCCCCCCCCCWLKIRALAFSYSTSRSSNVFTSAADVEGKGGSNTCMCVCVCVCVCVSVCACVSVHADVMLKRKESLIQHRILVKKWPPRSDHITPHFWFNFLPDYMCGSPR